MRKRLLWRDARVGDMLATAYWDEGGFGHIRLVTSLEVSHVGVGLAVTLLDLEDGTLLRLPYVPRDGLTMGQPPVWVE